MGIGWDTEKLLSLSLVFLLVQPKAQQVCGILRRLSGENVVSRGDPTRRQEGGCGLRET